MPLSNTKSKIASFPFIGLTVLGMLALGLALYLAPPALVPMLALLLLIVVPLLIMFSIGLAYTCCPKDKASPTVFTAPPNPRLSPANAARSACGAEVTEEGALGMTENPAGTHLDSRRDGETTKLLAAAPAP